MTERLRRQAYRRGAHRPCYDLPKQHIAWIGPGPVTIWNLDRDQGLPLKSLSSDLPPECKIAYRNRQFTGVAEDASLQVEIVNATVKRLAKDGSGFDDPSSTACWVMASPSL